MAFTLDNLIADEDIEVILPMDSALDVTPEEYASYLEDLDESKLKFKPGDDATRFVMRRSIPLKHATRIESSKVKYGVDGEVSLQLGFIIEEVRASLKGVKNPPGLPVEKHITLKFTGDGLVDERQMASLVAADAITPLYKGRLAAMRRAAGGSLKKS